MATTTTTATKNGSLVLAEPDFSIDENDKDLELWTFRLPVNVPLSAMKNVEMIMEEGSSKISASFSNDGKDYCIELGDPEENEAFRVLLPHKKKGDNDDDDDDDSESDSDNSGDSDSDSDDSDDDDSDGSETKKKKKKGKASNDNDNDNEQWNLQASKVGFSKHFKVLSAVPKYSEIQLAPREGPPSVDPMRHAYSHIPQRTGLKRRWMPLGVVAPIQGEEQPSTKKAKSTPVAQRKLDPVTSKTTPAHDESEDESSQDKDLTKSERKQKKSEKKAAKKAKKEAKKAKKSAKKTKKTTMKEEA